MPPWEDRANRRPSSSNGLTDVATSFRLRPWTRRSLSMMAGLCPSSSAVWKDTNSMCFWGRRATLERDQPRLLFECEERHDRERGVGAVFEYLESLGYVGQVFMGRDLLPLDQFDVRLHQDELKRPPMRTTLPSCIQTVSSYARESSLVHEVSRLPPGPPSLEASLSVATVYAQPKQTTSPVPATTSRWPHNQLIELTPPSAPPSSFARSPGGRPQHRGRRGRSTVLSQPCRCLRPLYLGRRRSPWPVSLICMRKDHMRKDSPENDAGSEVELG